MNDHLEHYGVLGMRWGVIRTPAQLGHLVKVVRDKFKKSDASDSEPSNEMSKKAKPEKVSEIVTNLPKKKDKAENIEEKEKPEKNAKKKKDTPISELSDDELRQRINRLNMEKQYRDLEASLSPKIKSVVKKLLSEAAENLGRQVLGKVVNNMVGKMFKDNSGNTFNLSISELNDVDMTNVGADFLKKAADTYVNANRINTTKKLLETESKKPEEKKQDSSESKTDNKPDNDSIYSMLEEKRKAQKSASKKR